MTAIRSSGETLDLAGAGLKIFPGAGTRLLAGPRRIVSPSSITFSGGSAGKPRRSSAARRAAAAGYPILADAEVIEHDRDLGDGRFLLELRGDSMEPRFHDLQRVILRDRATLKRPLLKYGQLYCFIHDGAACFKQWAKDDSGRKVLRSLNPEHADIPADHSTEWIGWFDPADNA